MVRNPTRVTDKPLGIALIEGPIKLGLSVCLGFVFSPVFTDQEPMMVELTVRDKIHCSACHEYRGC